MQDAPIDFTVLLKTERLTLRQFRTDDAPALCALDADTEVMRYISKGRPTPCRDIVEEFLPRVIARYEEYENQGFWAAQLTRTREFIGWFHLRPQRIGPPDMELGYRLKRSAWGRGYATEGSRGLIKKAFEEWQYPCVVATTLIDHHASRRVMEKAGMTLYEYFVYDPSVLSGWSPEERKAVRYRIEHPMIQV